MASLVAALTCIVAWGILWEGALAPLEAWRESSLASAVIFLAPVALGACLTATAAVAHASAAKPLHVWLTPDALVFGGLVGWGLRQVPYREIATCSRVTNYHLPGFVVCLDKVYWLPGRRDWAYSPHFHWGWPRDAWRAWQGVSLMLVDGRSVFIDMPKPEAFLRAIAGLGVTVPPRGGEPAGTH